MPADPEQQGLDDVEAMVDVVDVADQVLHLEDHVYHVESLSVKCL